VTHSIVEDVVVVATNPKHPVFDLPKVTMKALLQWNWVLSPGDAVANALRGAIYFGIEETTGHVICLHPRPVDRRDVCSHFREDLRTSMGPPLHKKNAMDPILGQIQLFAFSFAPKGWMLCDGATLPIRENTAVFSLVGTTYGGDGISTFALPHLVGKEPIAGSVYCICMDGIYPSRP
jgi:hypothetical protein